MTTDWVVLSSFRIDDGWIPSLIETPGRRFDIVEPRYQHDRSRHKAQLRDWVDYFAQGLTGWLRSRQRPDTGIVTVFPQLAVVAGVIKRLTRSRRPVVAWMFNLGQTYGGIQGALARFGLASVDHFVVHSRHEVSLYADWLQLPPDRFTFIPLSIDGKDIAIAEEMGEPFVLSMGTANRDYALLFRVLTEVGHRTIVVAAPHALVGIDVPPNIEVRSNLPIEECHALCQQARICVVPVKDTETAAGQVTVLEAMMYGRPVIATRCVGTVDYIENGVDGVLIDVGNHDGLKRAIVSLWEDTALRESLAVAARASATRKFTFAAVAPQFAATLACVTVENKPASAPSR